MSNFSLCLTGKEDAAGAHSNRRLGADSCCAGYPIESFKKLPHKKCLSPEIHPEIDYTPQHKGKVERGVRARET